MAEKGNGRLCGSHNRATIIRERRQVRPFSPTPPNGKCVWMVGSGGLLSSIRGFLTSETPPITVNIIETCSTGWKNLPQELVDTILTYLEDDFASLASCSLSCKALFCSTRPFIHRTFCLSTGCSIDRHRSSPLNRAQFDNLRLAGQAQVLRYATRLIIRLGDDFAPENLRPHLRYFRDMQGVTSLEIYLLDATGFLPTFEECFGHITPTLRSLVLSGARDSIQAIFHFISRFPLLQDLDLVQFSLTRHKPAQPYTPPEIKIPPPLNGALRFRGTYPSLEFIQSLINVPGGIHFRSVEMGDARRVPLQTVIDACSNTLESITFWTGYLEVVPNLRQCVVLKRLRIALAGGIDTYHSLQAYLSRVLSSITSPSFSTFVVRRDGPNAHDAHWPQPAEPTSDDFTIRGANMGTVFRVEAIGLLDHLSTGARHLLKLEPCNWDAE